jgi:ferrous iron transport protein B
MNCHSPASGQVGGRTVTALRPATVRVLLVGGPNVGKSTLFNALTGARQRTTNAPGTTVELASGTWRTAAPNARGLPHRADNCRPSQQLKPAGPLVGRAGHS